MSLWTTAAAESPDPAPSFVVHGLPDLDWYLGEVVVPAASRLGPAKRLRIAEAGLPEHRPAGVEQAIRPPAWAGKCWQFGDRARWMCQ